MYIIDHSGQITDPPSGSLIVDFKGAINTTTISLVMLLVEEGIRLPLNGM